MNKYNTIVSAVRTQLGSRPHNGLKIETDHTEYIQHKRVKTCTLISKVLETEMQKQLEGMKYE